MPKGPTPQSRITIRALASVYLLYLGYGLIKNWGDVPPNQRIGIGLAIAAFTVLPLYFLYTCWRDGKDIKAEEAAAREAEAQAALEGETVSDAGGKALEGDLAEDDSDEVREKLALAEKLAEEGRVEELDELLRQAAPKEEEQ